MILPDPLTPEAFFLTIVGAWSVGYAFGWAARLVHRHVTEFFR